MENIEYNIGPKSEKQKEIEKRLIEQHEAENKLPDNHPGIVGRAEFILRGIDLDFEDLKNKRVLDLGAGSGRIGRAGKNSGINNIISLDLKKEYLPKTRPELKGVAGDANKLPFDDESFDLIISNGAPPSSTRSTPDQLEKILEIINEIRRVLTPAGEARVVPAEFNFFARELRDIAKAKYSEKQMKIEQERVHAEARKKSLELLIKHKINVELEINNRGEYYWIIKK